MERYRVLVLGDGTINNNYSRNDRERSCERGAGAAIGSIRPFLEACDSVVVNLEAMMYEAVGPASGDQRVLRDPVSVGEQLRDMGVGAVNLANRTGDLGPLQLKRIIQGLNDCKIAHFGAGSTLLDAQEPYRLQLPARVGAGELQFHGSRASSNRNIRNAEFDRADSPGCAPLSVGSVPWARRSSTPENSFHVALPHWGQGYGWRRRSQYRLAHRFLRKDYDLVLGDGAHNLQEVHRKQRRWVVYGLGTGNSTSGTNAHRGDQEAEGLPFSFWAVLEVVFDGNHRRVELKLYPVNAEHPDDTVPGGPVSETDFNRIFEALKSRPARPWRLDNPAQRAGKDSLGFFLALDLGAWPTDKRPAHLEPILDTGDPGDWLTQGPSAEIEDKVMALNKTVGAGMLTLNAEDRGGTSKWLTENLALVEVTDKRFLTYQYKAHESILGATICIDKVLSASFFESAEVDTPKTVPVDSADEAVREAAKISGPVVVKPRRGTKSRGVSTGLVRDDEIREAYAFAKQHGSQVLVQQHIEATEELRVMASPMDAVAVIRRILPHVTGDGASTVEQLIEDKNQQRSLNPSLRSGRPIPVDSHTQRHLSQQGYSLHSVLALGDTITVRNIAALSAGADAHQALESADPRIKQTAAAAVGAIPGLGWGGVDLIIEKETQKPYVIEINTNAAYGAALFPTYGNPLNVAERVWDLRYEATVPDVRTAPEHPDPLSEARSLGTTIGHISSRAGTLRFSELFTNFLRQQQYQVSPHGGGVLHVCSPEGTKSWVTETGFTEEDRSIVWQVMRRHPWVRQLLRIGGIPTPRGREVSSAEALQRFTEGRISQVLLFPTTGSWEGPNAYVMDAAEVVQMPSLPARSWIQTRPRGERVRVLATPQKAWAVAASSELPPKSDVSVGVASELAVRAVRAIPELRWAVVDILVRPRRIHENRPGGALVEGLSITPTFSSDIKIIAGSLEAFAQQVVGDGRIQQWQ